MPDSFDDYDIHDRKSREHEAYKTCQNNYSYARLRYLYGDLVDARTPNYNPSALNDRSSMESKLANAQEARRWALDEANRRYAWNAKWMNGSHTGITNEADKRMRAVQEYWDPEIDRLKWLLDQAKGVYEDPAGDDSWPESDHDNDNDSDDDEDQDLYVNDDEEYEKIVLDARDMHERVLDSDFDEVADEHEFDEDNEGDYDDLDGGQHSGDSFSSNDYYNDDDF